MCSLTDLFEQNQPHSVRTHYLPSNAVLDTQKNVFKVCSGIVVERHYCESGDEREKVLITRVLTSGDFCGLLPGDFVYQTFGKAYVQALPLNTVQALPTIEGVRLRELTRLNRALLERLSTMQGSVATRISACNELLESLPLPKKGKLAFIAELAGTTPESLSRVKAQGKLAL